VTGNDRPIRVERLLPAPIEEVFDALTDATRMAEWFTFGRAEVEADPVVGGHLRVVMIDEDVRIEHDGEFLEVRRPTRLSFTWRSRFTGDQPTVVTIELSEEDDETRLVLQHDRLPPEERASHAGGWGEILDRLAAVVGASTDGEGS
jgi:uncharacterized protein YndB with AHSA1/START domain